MSIKISEYALTVWAIKDFISEHTSKANMHTEAVIEQVRRKYEILSLESLNYEHKELVEKEIVDLINERVLAIISRSNSTRTGAVGQNRTHSPISIEDLKKRRLMLLKRYLESIRKAYSKQNLQEKGQENDLPRVGAVALWEADFPYVENIKSGERPVLLFYEGDISLIRKSKDRLNFTVIGLVNPTDEIIENEKAIVETLVKKNAVITSGLALGCDQIAHEVALECGGKTVAILPSPIFSILPPRNQPLARQIVENGGLLISEYYRLPRHKYELINRFIERDRLQAMFCDAVLLVASYSKEKAEELQELGKSLIESIKGCALPDFISAKLHEFSDAINRRAKEEPESIREELLRYEAELNTIITRQEYHTDDLHRIVERTVERTVERIVERIASIRFDSGARHAMEKAKEYRVPRIVMYDESRDTNNGMFSLNRNIIQDNNSGTVYIIGCEFEGDIERIIERLQTTDSISPTQPTQNRSEDGGAAQKCTAETQPESQTSSQSTEQSTEDDFELIP